MKKYTNENPEFSETLNIVETSDPAHADKINDAPKQLLQNTLVNSKSIGELRVTVKEQASPTFDDSGETEAISSFEDFKSSIKSKMNIFEFFRNLKAGLKYVMHVGQIVNNTASDATNLPLSAAMGKSLQSQINVLNAKMSSETSISTSATNSEIRKMNLYNGAPVVITGEVHNISWPHGIVLYISPWNKTTLLLTDDDSTVTFLLHLHGDRTISTAAYKDL